METDFLLRAFARDFEVNGPSVVRMARTLLQGWQRYKHSPDLRVRRRIAWEVSSLSTQYAGAVWAARKWFANKPELHARIDAVLQSLYQEFGLKTRLAAPLVGRYIYRQLVHENQRLQRGWTYEPPTFYEKTHQRHGRPHATAEGVRAPWLPSPQAAG
jgi:hypothetical protein